jgi:predicted RNA methylase
MLKTKMKVYSNWWSTETFIPYDRSNVKKVVVNDAAQEITVHFKDREPLYFSYVKGELHNIFTYVIQIFIWDIYHIDNIKGRVVLDIGSGVGDSPIYFAMKGARKVYAYDTDKARCELALKNIKKNGFEDKIEVFNKPYDFMDLSKFKDMIIKFDCEGAEYDLFKKIDFSTVSDVVMEYHKGYDTLKKTLSDSGFEVEVEPKTTLHPPFKYNSGNLWARKSR